jgi:hypothetical protein
MGKLTYQSPELVLEHIAMRARPYPAASLEGCETGLVLFAAAYMGHNDAIHFAEAGIPTVCVDTDGERLEYMQQLYAKCPGWSFVEMDAWIYARGCGALETTFDVVSLDPFSGDCMQHVLEDVELWASLANRVLILGIAAGYTYRMPRGWRLALEDVERARGVWWSVLRRS